MVKIENYLNNRFFAYYINRTIKNLLKFIPQRDLIGIEKIAVYNTFNGKNKNNAALYWEKNEKEPTLIEISFDSVFHKMPIVLMFMPFVGRFLLASALYHEIGHHCHHSFKHGVKKKKSETFAERYKKEMLQKAFWGWRLLLRPLAPFARYMANRNRSEKE
ncbi:MAG: hypothetical protein SV062_03525 [Thermodesulfobacteriota bacterium]|nr:hypothetical protein [Thermodesulfobacteriota bacterium]